MRFLIYIMTCFLWLSSLAQGGFRVRHYLPAAKNGITKDIFETSPGNYLACGITIDTINGVNTNRLTIMKLGSQGQLIWVKKYGTKNLEYLNNNFISRAFYKHNNFIYLACCVRDSNNKYIGALVKFDFNGDTLWQKFYRDSMDVIPQMVTSSIDGGFLMTGFFQDWNGAGRPCLLIKTDSHGHEIWRKKINKAGHNVSDGKAIIQDSATKKIVILGYQYVGSSQSSSMKDNVLVVDSLGNTIWRRYYSGFGGHLLDAIQTKDKNIVAVGVAYKSQMIGANLSQCSFIVKIDLNASPTASPIWYNTTFDGIELYNIFTCLRELPNGDILVGGLIDTNSYGIKMLHRYTYFGSNGTFKKQLYFSYKTNDTTVDNNQGLSSLNLTTDGGWVVSIPQAYNPGPNPLFYVKYDSTGCDSTTAYCLNPVGLFNLYQISGYSFDVFPNPTSNTVNFRIDGPNYGIFQIKIVALCGKEIEQFNLDSKQALQLNTEKYSSGIYFVSVFLDGKSVETKKLVIVK